MTEQLGFLLGLRLSQADGAMDTGVAGPLATEAAAEASAKVAATVAAMTGGPKSDCLFFKVTPNPD